MTKFIRWLSILSLLILACMPVVAQADWQDAYSTVLTQAAKAKRLTALCDITGDGKPELFVLTYSNSKTVNVKAYTSSGSSATSLLISGSDFDSNTFLLQGTTKAGMQLRVNASGERCLTLNLSASFGGKASATQIGITDGSSGKLSVVHLAYKEKQAGKTGYKLNGKAVTATQYAAGVKSFENTYKKKGTLPTQAITAANASSAINTRLKSLNTRYAKYAAIKTLKISKASGTMGVGESVKLAASFTPATAVLDKLTWSSSAPGVATVSADGKVTAVATGKATITVSSQSGKTKTCALTVTGAQPAGVTLSINDMTLVKGATHTLTATVSPAGIDDSIAWSSSNAAVASVTQKGLITALKSGKAVITAKTANGKTATCKVVVNDRNAVIVDISQHNYSTKMDWAKIAKNVDLLILRCGVTRTGTAPLGIGIDARFAFYAEKCKEYGIPFGVYYYGKVSTEAEAKKEAEMTWKTASPYNPLFYVYDVEESRLTKSVIETYITHLKSLGAKKTGYYIAHHLYATYKLDTKMVDFIWIPHYGKNNGTVNSTPKHTCDIHQFTSQGKIAGFPGVVDVNRLMGTKQLSWYLTR